MGKKKTKVRWTAVEETFFVPGSEEESEGTHPVNKESENSTGTPCSSSRRGHNSSSRAVPSAGPHYKSHGAHHAGASFGYKFGGRRSYGSGYQQGQGSSGSTFGHHTPLAPRFERKAQAAAAAAAATATATATEATTAAAGFGSYFEDDDSIFEAEQLPDGFTKIRSKNLDVLFKRDYYAQKIENNRSNGSSEIGEEEDENGTENALKSGKEDVLVEGDDPNDSGDEEEEIEEDEDDEEEEEVDKQLGVVSRISRSNSSYSPNANAPPFVPSTSTSPRPNLFLYSPSSNTMIPCEEIIIPNPVMGPEGPVYQGPSNIYLAFPTPGSDAGGGPTPATPTPAAVTNVSLMQPAYVASSTGSDSSAVIQYDQYGVPYNSQMSSSMEAPATSSSSTTGIQFTSTAGSSQDNPNAMYLSSSEGSTEPGSGDSTTPHSPPDLSIYSPAEWAADANGTTLPSYTNAPVYIMTQQQDQVSLGQGSVVAQQQYPGGLPREPLEDQNSLGGEQWRQQPRDSSPATDVMQPNVDKHHLPTSSSRHGEGYESSPRFMRVEQRSNYHSYSMPNGRQRPLSASFPSGSPIEVQSEEEHSSSIRNSMESVSKRLQQRKATASKSLVDFKKSDSHKNRVEEQPSAHARLPNEEENKCAEEQQKRHIPGLNPADMNNTSTTNKKMQKKRRKKKGGVVTTTPATSNLAEVEMPQSSPCTSSDDHPITIQRTPTTDVSESDLGLVVVEEEWKTVPRRKGGVEDFSMEVELCEEKKEIQKISLPESKPLAPEKKESEAVAKEYRADSPVPESNSKPSTPKQAKKGGRKIKRQNADREDEKTKESSSAASQAIPEPSSVQQQAEPRPAQALGESNKKLYSKVLMTAEEGASTAPASSSSSQSSSTAPSLVSSVTPSPASTLQRTPSKRAESSKCNGKGKTSEQKRGSADKWEEVSSNKKNTPQQKSSRPAEQGRRRRRKNLQPAETSDFKEECSGEEMTLLERKQEKKSSATEEKKAVQTSSTEEINIGAKFSFSDKTKEEEEKDAPEIKDDTEAAPERKKDGNKRRKKRGTSGEASEKVPTVRPVLIQDGLLDLGGHHSSTGAPGGPFRRVKRASEVLDPGKIEEAVLRGHLDALMISAVGHGMGAGPLAMGRFGLGKYCPPDRVDEIPIELRTPKEEDDEKAENIYEDEREELEQTEKDLANVKLICETEELDLD